MPSLPPTPPSRRPRLSFLNTKALLLQLERLRPRLTVWLAALEPETVEAGEYKILIEEAKVEAQHMMSEAEEILAAELSLSGGAAWAKLHGNLTSLITASVNGEELPMSSVRLLAMNPDRAVRKAAYTAELAAWEANEVALAAALNGWKGERSTLNANAAGPTTSSPPCAKPHHPSGPLGHASRYYGELTDLAAVLPGQSQSAFARAARVVGSFCPHRLCGG